MRTLFLLALLAAVQSRAATYYLSATTGNDRYSAAEARSRATPWRTIEKLNQSWPLIQPGDSILLRSGERFRGPLVVRKSGKAGAPIYIGAYGSGPRPIISGLVSLDQWQQVGPGQYEAMLPGDAPPALAMVVIDGRPAAMGRYPNATDANKGYLNIEEHQGKTVLVHKGLAGADWTGAAIVVRTNHYIIDTATIQQQSGGTLTISPGTAYEVPNRNGFFIQNHPRTLDRDGEWYYDPQRRVLRVYFTGNPARRTVQVATVDKLVSCYDVDHIVLDGLQLEGAQSWGAYHYSAAYNVVRNCIIRFCGETGIRSAQAGNIRFEAHNNTISDIGTCGMDLRGTTRAMKITGNTLTRIGINEGMGISGTHTRTAIAFNMGAGHEVAYNRIDSVGYAGIRWGGDSIDIHHNYISNFCFVLDDGGGILTGNGGKHPQSFRKVHHNIVVNGFGAAAGTIGNANQASGIYFDDNTTDVATFSNVVAHVGNNGILHHNNRNVRTYNNLVYDCGDAQAELTHDAEGRYALQDVLFRNNILVARTSRQWLLKVMNKTDSVAIAGINLPNGGFTGITHGIDSNLYLRPLNADSVGVFVAWRVYSGRGVEQRRFYTISEWSKTFGHDLASKGAPVRFAKNTPPDEAIHFWYNPDTQPMTVRLKTPMRDVWGRLVKGSITVAPYGGLILLRDSR